MAIKNLGKVVPEKGVDYFTDEDIRSLNIPKNTSDLINDSSYATESYVKNQIADAQLGGESGEVDLSGYATKDDLHNHSNKNILDDISSDDIAKWNAGGNVDLSNYATKDELNNKANVSAIPTKTSQLTNDSGYMTSYTESDPTVPAHVKAITQNDINKWNNNSGGISLLSVETITIDDEGGEVVTVPVIGLGLDLTSYNATVGDCFYINPVINPSDATNKKVSWKSNNNSVATVDSGGYVETISAGDAVITCTTDDGGFTATCSVKVAEAQSGGEDPTINVTSITLDKTSLTLKVDETATLVATVLPTDATNKNVTWTSSDNTKATVSNGVVTAIADGNVTITAKSVSNSSVSATCSVTIEAKEQEPSEEPSDEPSSGTKIQFSTLELASGGFKADGTAHTLGNTYNITLPYSEGMQIRTLWNASWAIKTYPAIMVLNNGTYSTPNYEVALNDDGSKKTMTVGGKIGNLIDATLTGYAEGSSVIVQMMIGSTQKETMDNTDYLWYIVGGGN